MRALHTTDTKKQPDGALVAAAKRGDTHAFEELVLRHRRKVVAMAQRIINDREDAEDVAQESFHKAFLHLDSFQQKSRFSTWLTRIAMNEAFMSLRRKRGALEVSPESIDNDTKPNSELFVDPTLNPEESCWRRERSDLLTKAINRLSPTIGRTILLRDIEGRSIEETAQMLGSTISAVKARVFQGRRKLRRILNPGLLTGPCELARAETHHS
jgi:RNA polymerase sigma-70 factor (ECF subfamily)